MPTNPTLRNNPWLKSPFRTAAGTLKLAGSLEDVPGIDPASMRVLGSYALVLMVDADGYFVDGNGHSQALKPADAVLIFPDIPHAYGPGPGSSWHQIYVVFEGMLFDDLRAAGILSPTNPVWHLEPLDYWVRRLEEVFQPVRPQSKTTALRALGRFVHLLTDMAATHAEAKRPPEQVWVEESMHLLAEPTHDGWLSPQAVATTVGLSYESFRKQFARHTGDSPARFRKRRRIEHACAAIYQGSRSFKELAEELGFCDEFHFSRAFRQVIGESPSAFRRRIRG